MKKIEELREQLQEYIQQNGFDHEPKGLYDPLEYILGLGGKRLRPICLLLVNEMFGGNIAHALSAAYAIELFHNFSLIHDDIMDNAPLRRGKTTVHEKWDLNTGILSGDAMLIYSYQYLTASCNSSNSQQIHKLFTETAISVCEGQQMDVDFESQKSVGPTEYIEMIYKKTGALIEGAMQIGAILADAPKEDVNHIGLFAKNLGISFQLQDDILDAFGNMAKVGKQIGGDIIQNKKTILYILAKEKACDQDLEELNELYSQQLVSEHKIQRVMSIFEKNHVRQAAEDLRNQYHEAAFASLNEIKVEEELKAPLTVFANNLLDRKY